MSPSQEEELLTTERGRGKADEFNISFFPSTGEAAAEELERRTEHVFSVCLCSSNSQRPHASCVGGGVRRNRNTMQTFLSE